VGYIFFFFEKFLILQAGEPKYWGPRKIFSILGSEKFCESCQIWLVGDIDKKNKNTPHKLVEVSPKKFSARSDLKSPRKRGKTWFLVPKNRFWEKWKKKIFFSTFYFWLLLTRGCFTASCIKFAYKKKKLGFWGLDFGKPGFSEVLRFERIEMLMIWIEHI